MLALLPIPRLTQRKRNHRPQPFLAAPREQLNKQKTNLSKRECNLQSTCIQREESRENIAWLFGAPTLDAKVPSLTLEELALHPPVPVPRTQELVLQLVLCPPHLESLLPTSTQALQSGRWELESLQGDCGQVSWPRVSHLRPACLGSTNSAHLTVLRDQ